MAGRFIIKHNNIKYYRFPVEAWRGLLDAPQQVFNLCEALICADCNGIKELRDVYDLNIASSRPMNERTKIAGNMKREGQGFLNKLGMAGNAGTVYFTISVRMYWQYREDCCAGKLKEWDWLLLLWWMALHTIDGKRKGATAVHNATNADVFRRAAGFSNWADYKVYQWDGDEAILKYILKPARYAARLREDLMQKFDTFHAYSIKGRRGWCFMLARVNRQHAFDMMAAHMANHRSTKQQFKAELSDMRAKARAKAAGEEIVEAVGSS